MKIKVEKDGIVKELDNDGLVADYIASGWKRVEENKIKSSLDMNKGK